jgi:hypothetical protein
LSAFQFGEDFRQLLLDTGSTAGYSGPCWSPWLWFDIDNEDLHFAHNDAAALAAALVERYEVLPADLLMSAADATMLITLKETASYLSNAGVRMFKSVAVLGAGSVGICMVRFAKIFGADPLIVVARRDEQLAYAKKLGADFAVNVTSADANAEVKRLNGGRGVDFVIDTTGDVEFLATVAPMLALPSSFWDDMDPDVPRPDQPSPLDHLPIEVQLVGETIAAAQQSPSEEYDRAMDELDRFIEAHPITEEPKPKVRLYQPAHDLAAGKQPRKQNSGVLWLQPQRFIEVGDSLVEHPFLHACTAANIVGVYSPPSGARIKLSLASMQEVLEAPNKCTYILVKVNDGVDPKSVAARINDALPGNTINLTEDLVIDAQERIPGVKTFLRVLVALGECK